MKLREKILSFLPVGNTHSFTRSFLITRYRSMKWNITTPWLAGPLNEEPKPRWLQFENFSIQKTTRLSLFDQRSVTAPKKNEKLENWKTAASRKSFWDIHRLNATRATHPVGEKVRPEKQLPVHCHMPVPSILLSPLDSFSQPSPKCMQHCWLRLQQSPALH